VPDERDAADGIFDGRLIAGRFLLADFFCPTGFLFTHALSFPCRPRQGDRPKPSAKNDRTGLPGRKIDFLPVGSGTNTPPPRFIG
jgi:hypothetical protein